jgi:hypothetical protein
MHLLTIKNGRPVTNERVTHFYILELEPVKANS